MLDTGLAALSCLLWSKEARNIWDTEQWWSDDDQMRTRWGIIYMHGAMSQGPHPESSESSIDWCQGQQLGHPHQGLLPAELSLNIHCTWHGGQWGEAQQKWPMTPRYRPLNLEANLTPSLSLFTASMVSMTRTGCKTLTWAQDFHLLHNNNCESGESFAWP